MKLIPITLICTTLMLAGCVQNPDNMIDINDIDDLGSIVTGSQSDFNADSWKEIIPSSCQSFYDGCNHCGRTGDGSEDIVCTEMYCEIYSQPYCNDDLTMENSMSADEKREYFVGLSFDEAASEASKLGIPFRVVEIDGVSQATTDDLREGRINATLKDGYVVDIDVE